MRETIFITGASGTIGQNLVSLFLKQTQANLILLIHDKIPTLNPVDQDRVKFFQGDITKKNLGLTEVQIQKITSYTSTIIHSAATTRFDMPLSQAHLINVKGTENVMDLALTSYKKPNIAFLSTVYISGKRTGTITEENWRHTSGFVNTYEQSKYEAEILLDRYRLKLPIATYRLSTIIGNSKTGAVQHYTAPHQALRIMYLGMAGVIPGTPDYIVDLLPSNIAAEILFQLINQNFQPHKNFHITSGIEKSFTLQELIDASFQLLGTYDKKWAVRNYAKPLFVNTKAFDLFMKSAAESDNIFIAGVMRAMKHFAHQLLYKKEFDNTNVLQYIPDYNNLIPHIKTYYPKVVRYCLKHRWKNPHTKKNLSNL